MYVDRELPSPWKERLEEHTRVCPRCAGHLAALQSLRTAFAAKDADEEALCEAAASRVWGKLAERTEGRRQTILFLLITRRVSVPLPALAAFSLVFLLVFALLFTAIARSPVSTRDDGAQTIAQERIPVYPAQDSVIYTGDVPVSAQTTLGDIIKYLEASSAQDVPVVNLPQGRRFSTAGEPALVPASSYNSRRPAR